MHVKTTRTLFWGGKSDEICYPLWSIRERLLQIQCINIIDMSH